jgi:uncharacterized protein YciI
MGATYAVIFTNKETEQHIDRLRKQGYDVQTDSQGQGSRIVVWANSTTEASAIVQDLLVYGVNAYASAL